ncbi:MAG: hypothetical protein JWO50_16 [Candidatus Kaiserbacteria bacterium]|nr:hypothetical protein [Candidatus Kaiserbacteria bacterium]
MEHELGPIAGLKRTPVVADGLIRLRTNEVDDSTVNKTGLAGIIRLEGSDSQAISQLDHVHDNTPFTTIVITRIPN